MGVVFFIERFQYPDDFSAHQERNCHQGLSHMASHAVNHFEMTLIRLHILDDERLTFAVHPTRCTSLDGNAHWAQQVAFKPVHRQEAQLLSRLIILKNGCKFTVRHLSGFVDDSLQKRFEVGSRCQTPHYLEQTFQVINTLVGGHSLNYTTLTSLNNIGFVITASSNYS